MSEAEFRFLTLEDVLELHEMQLEQYGGATGIRAPDLLESAVMMPLRTDTTSYNFEICSKNRQQNPPLSIFRKIARV